MPSANSRAVLRSRSTTLPVWSSYNRRRRLGISNSLSRGEHVKRIPEYLFYHDPSDRRSFSRQGVRDQNTLAEFIPTDLASLVTSRVSAEGLGALWLTSAVYLVRAGQSQWLTGYNHIINQVYCH